MTKTLLALLLAASAARADAPSHVHPADEGAATPAHQKHPIDPDAPKPAGEAVTLDVGGGHSLAYVARPKAKPAGAVLVLHEWWGLNDWVKSEADELAKLGYLALAVDLYDGHVATDPATATKLMQSVDAAKTGAVAKAGVAWLKKAAPAAKIATLGWCFGGGQSLRASLAAAPDVAATVMYYGMPDATVAELKTLRGPLLGIWANRDGWITPAVVAKFDAALTEAGVKHAFHAYDADHAFANPTGGRYNPPDAKDAWANTVEFLAANLK